MDPSPCTGACSAAPRLRPPAPLDDVVARPRLLGRLDDGAGLLTIVVAPAGFGKTTLLAQWALARRRVAWLSLDETDADPDVLWTHVMEAVLHAAATDDARVVEPTPAGAAALVEALAPAAIVLDRYERIHGSAADASLWRFARDRPPLQLVVSGRPEPSAPLAAARARGELVELRTRELRLTPAEARALVGGTAARGDLVALCDGWGAGLRLALHDGSRAEWEGHVRELVTHEVLRGRDEEHAFLTRTAILDELSPALCDRVLATGGSERMLAHLERESLLVERIGVDGSYRLERAARHVLEPETARQEPALARALHRRAAGWYDRARRPGEAVEHLLACGDTQAAARRVARAWPAVVGAGGQAQALRWLERLPASPRDVRLALARGWLLRLDGRRDESDLWLDAARRAAPLRARPAVVRACVLARAALPWDDVGGSLALARRAWRSEQHGPRRPLAAWALGWASWWSGDVEAAATALPDALNGPVLVRVAAQVVLARIELARGNTSAAAALLAQSTAAAGRRGLDGLPQLGMAATASGLLAAARGDDSAALAAFERGIRARRGWGHPLETADALVAAAPVVASRRGRREAADLLGEARRLVAACPDPGVLPERLAGAVRAALPRPDAGGGDELTPRERTVLRLLAAGRSKREIAVELFVSYNTVHSHTKAVYRKLRLSSRRDAVERARELGLS